MPLNSQTQQHRAAELLITKRRLPGVGWSDLVMIVFRVQDATGRGPWKPGFSHKWVEDRPDHDNLPPWFVEFGRVDRRAIIGMTTGSACVTLEQLQRWFTPTEYAKLHKLGYHAVSLEASVLAESAVQCFVQRAKPFTVDAEMVDLYT